MIKEYEGIVIKSINYKESDKILQIFTREAGKLSCIARGVRKVNKKSEINVDLFSHSRYNLYKGRGFYHVNQSERINSFFDLREDLERLSYASYILEIVDSGIVEEEENKRAFDLLIKTLAILSKKETSSKKLLMSFQLKFISFIGYRPELKTCISCGQEKQALLTCFSILSGGVLCNSCRGISNQNHFQNLSEDMLLALKKLLYFKLEDVSAIEMLPSDMKRLEHIVQSYMFGHLDKSYFKSLEILRALNLI